MVFKNLFLFLVAGITGGNAQTCAGRCGTRKLQVFFVADMSMNMCSDNSTMEEYMDGVVEFAKQAEAECPGGFGMGYGVMGDKSELNPLFCHITYVDVYGTASNIEHHIRDFDFRDGVGKSTLPLIGDIYQRAANQYWTSDAVHLVIALTNNMYGKNDGTEPNMTEYGACGGRGCDCPGPYLTLHYLTDMMDKHDVNVGFITTPCVANQLQQTSNENGWDAAVESPIEIPSTDQIWRVVEKFTSPHPQTTNTTTTCRGQFIQHYFAMDKSRRTPTQDELNAMYDAYEDLICTLQRYTSEGLIPGFEVGFGYYMSKGTQYCHGVQTDFTENAQTAIDALRSLEVGSGTTRTHIEELFRDCTELNWKPDTYKVIVMMSDDVPSITDPGEADLNMTDTGFCPDGCDCPGPYYDLQTTGDKIKEVGAHVSILSLSSFHDYLAQWQQIISDGHWEDFAYVTQLNQDSNVNEALWDATFQWCRW